MRSLRRPLLEVAAFHGLLGWFYVAACAAARPDDMSQAIAAVLPIRRDTFGACCFAVSALSAFALQVRGEAHRPRRPLTPGPAAAALRTVTGYALLVWAYLSVNSLTHPETIGRRLTHFSPTPAEGTTAVVCFAVSAAALLVLRVVTVRHPTPAASRG